MELLSELFGKRFLKLIQAEAAFVDIISKQSSKCGGQRENIGAYVVHAEEANNSSYRAIDLNSL